mmetsp:Transcript_123843/g.214337  ORF Transcript_123843/g.214337 Transcript_123843/m.214337 type:complete len:250 (+) Transcript_123843:226-975(+)
MKTNMMMVMVMVVTRATQFIQVCSKTKYALRANLGAVLIQCAGENFLFTVSLRMHLQVTGCKGDQAVARLAACAADVEESSGCRWVCIEDLVAVIDRYSSLRWLLPTHLRVGRHLIGSLHLGPALLERIGADWHLVVGTRNWSMNLHAGRSSNATSAANVKGSSIHRGVIVNHSCLSARCSWLNNLGLHSKLHLLSIPFLQILGLQASPRHLCKFEALVFTISWVVCRPWCDCWRGWCGRAAGTLLTLW